MSRDSKNPSTTDRPDAAESEPSKVRIDDVCTHGFLPLGTPGRLAETTNYSTDQRPSLTVDIGSWESSECRSRFRRWVATMGRPQKYRIRRTGSNRCRERSSELQPWMPSADRNRLTNSGPWRGGTTWGGTSSLILNTANTGPTAALHRATVASTSSGRSA